MKELKHGKEVQEEALSVHYKSSIWKEDYWLVILVRKLSFLRFLLWPILIFIVYGALNYSGFCFKELRYISNDEKIRGAIANMNSDHRWDGYINALNRGGGYMKYIPYDNIDAFLKENPNCCTVDHSGFADDGAPSFWERVFGSYNYSIKMKYIQKFIEGPLDENKKEGAGKKREHLFEGWFTAGNCGDFCCED